MESASNEKVKQKPGPKSRSVSTPPSAPPAPLAAPGEMSTTAIAQGHTSSTAQKDAVATTEGKSAGDAEIPLTPSATSGAREMSAPTASGSNNTESPVLSGSVSTVADTNQSPVSPEADPKSASGVESSSAPGADTTATPPALDAASLGGNPGEGSPKFPVVSVPVVMTATGVVSTAPASATANVAGPTDAEGVAALATGDKPGKSQDSAPLAVHPLVASKMGGSRKGSGAQSVASAPSSSIWDHAVAKKE